MRNFKQLGRYEESINLSVGVGVLRLNSVDALRYGRHTLTLNQALRVKSNILKKTAIFNVLPYKELGGNFNNFLILNTLGYARTFKKFVSSENSQYVDAMAELYRFAGRTQVVKKRVGADRVS